jgi:hypothetical protein
MKYTAWFKIASVGCMHPDASPLLHCPPQGLYSNKVLIDHHGARLPLNHYEIQFPTPDFAPRFWLWAMGTGLANSVGCRGLQS